ncbi:MAG TPA: phospholipase D-like domain-containing protein [Anaerolineales bacterium]|nr:phospholipase D-like domain-containing protein [Anaerolineales bacterium]
MKTFNRTLVFLLVASISLSACDVVPETPIPEADEITPIDLQSGYGIRGPWFELYMTNPDSPLSPQGTGGLDGPLVEAIDTARLSIDVAVYSLSLNSVRYALIRAHERGVTVRLVMESNNMDRSDVRYLLEAGIPIIGDNRAGLMHDKFMIIDRSEVWLGSMNFTDSGTYEDNNNMIRILSTEIAENFLVEFNEMFESDLFGPDILSATPNPEIMLDDTRIDTYFSPDDGVLTVLYNLLSEADESIYFLAFSFTSNELGEIVRTQADAGLDIKGVMDREQVASNTGTEFDPFRQAGLDVRIDGNDGQMHHKVFILDEKIVVMGSYNFSRSAEERNDEGIVIIYNEDIAKFFMDEFERVYENAVE